MRFTAVIAAAILAFNATSILAAPIPQLAGEGAACNSILSSTDNGVGHGVENAEDGLAQSVPAGARRLRMRQLAGEGAACNSILSSTDNGVGHGVENAEDGLAQIVSTKPAAKRQLDKIADGTQTLSQALGTGQETEKITTAADQIDGESTSGAANLGADIGTLEEGTLSSAGSAVRMFRRQLDKIADGTQTLSQALGTGQETQKATTAADQIDGESTSGAANIGADTGALEEGVLSSAGSAVRR